MLRQYVPSFGLFEELGHENYKKYIRGKEPLKRTVLPHPTGDKVYDYVWSQMKHDFWMKDREKWRKQLARRRKNVRND